MYYSLAAGALALSGLVASAAPDLSKLPAAADKKNVTYSQDIQAIFKENCFGCHVGDHPRAGLRLDSLEATLKGASSGPVVVPAKGDQSKLLLAVARLDERDAMPPAVRAPRSTGTNTPAGAQRPASKTLTTEQVALIRAWIDQGAK